MKLGVGTPPGRLGHLSLVLTSFVVLRLALAALGPGPQLQPDSPMYLPIDGERRFGQVDFLGNSPRPWVVTMPYALAEDPKLVVVVQAGLGLLAWCCLLAAVWQVPYRTRTARWVAIAVIAALGLDATTTYWDSIVLSESLALSAGVALAAACMRLTSDLMGPATFALLGLGILVGGSIRVVMIIPASVMMIYLTIRLVRHRVRDREVRWQAVGLVVLLMLAAYVLVINSRMDRAWGADFMQAPDVNGRTLQQVGVINMTDWGHQAVQDVATGAGYPCLASYYARSTQSDDWRRDMHASCPTEVAGFSRAFPSAYARWLARHPRLSIHVLSGPFSSGFGAIDDSTTISLVPGVITSLYAEGAPTGRNPVLLMVLLVLVGAVLLFRDGRHWDSKLLLLGGVSAAAVLAVLLTVMVSPTDTFRVASAPAMVARITGLIGIVLVADAWITRVRGRPGIPVPDAT
jgi:hypothetical protein